MKSLINKFVTTLLSNWQMSLSIKKSYWFLRGIHRYIGLIVGMLFIIIGLSGSVLAFWQSIDEWLNAPLMVVQKSSQQPNAAYRSLDDMLKAAKNVITEGGVAEIIRLPRHSEAAVIISYSKSTVDHKMDFYDIFVNPYTATVNGQRLRHSADSEFVQPFTYLMRSLHYTLFLGRNNSQVVGIPALFLFLSMFVGLVLWWPRNNQWRKALTIKQKSSVERLTYDLHKTVGIYFGGILIVIMFTGIALIFSTQTRSIVTLFSAVKMPFHKLKLQSEPIVGEQPLDIDTVVSIANQLYPDGKLQSIILPKTTTDVYRIGKHADEEVNQAFTKRVVTIDQYSGKILDIQDPQHFSGGEIFISWLYPLHSGEAFGNVGRVIAFVMGFVPLVLFITGFIRWQQKRKAVRQRL